jgi:hypothetical protein
MRTWLAKLFRVALCEHHWRILETYMVESSQGKEVAKVYIQQCTKCGAMHNHRAGIFS